MHFFTVVYFEEKWNIDLVGDLWILKVFGVWGFSVMDLL